jgi:hypothetical protein
MARAFKKGDFRAGYYRDQTFMMALGELTVQQYFAQLYAHTNVEADPASAGRLMNGHFATRSLNEDGSWKSLTSQYNASADISPTAAQMPKLLGLAFASKLFRNNKGLKDFADFSVNGNEVAWGTIGNASTSEGMFFESMNAAGVLQVPMVVAVWDDGFGISVPKEFHTTKGSISEALLGLQRTDTEQGFAVSVEEGFKEKVASNFSMSDALKMAYDLLLEKAIKRGPVPSDLEMEIIESLQFNMVKGFCTTGRNIRVRVQVKPGLIHGFDSIADMLTV